MYTKTSDLKLLKYRKSSVEFNKTFISMVATYISFSKEYRMYSDVLLVWNKYNRILISFLSQTEEVVNYIIRKVEVP